MTLQDILRSKGSEVHTIGPDATLNDVVQELVRYNMGSLIVCEAQAEDQPPCMIGIVTERDILRAWNTHKGAMYTMRVNSVMSTEPVTAAPTDRIEHAMGLMTQHRFRHLPILDNGRLRGVISIGDIVKCQHDELAMENYYMHSYIQGEGAEIGTVS